MSQPTTWTLIVRKSWKMPLLVFDWNTSLCQPRSLLYQPCGNKVMEISEDGATIYLGDYDYYLEKKAELEELARLEAEENQGPEETQVASAGASDYQAQKASQKEIRKLSRRIEQIENELETVEERLGKISIAMLETNDVVELSDLQKELDDLSVNTRGSDGRVE